MTDDAYDEMSNAVALLRESGGDGLRALEKLLFAIEKSYSIESVTQDSLLYAQGAAQQCRLLREAITMPKDGDHEGWMSQSPPLPRVETEWTQASTAALAASFITKGR